ncbi:amidase domain-containing protein [Bacillus sp. FJAT-45350]|uniref:amidase domain-containing protein n=1 Tax=Bacillus sp. FJAT-45350 TaxID=2011014 RepID=UPI000BB95B9C|nr:amidase domain-containing protein [Bacillus sp. FJAT-45350]
MSQNIRIIKELAEERNQWFVNKSEERCRHVNIAEHECLLRKKKQCRNRNANIVKSIVNGQVISQQHTDNETVLSYLLHFQHLIKEKNEQHYIEEYQQERKATFRNGELKDDIEVIKEYDEEIGTIEREDFEEGLERFTYDRREAVRYAERWWNDYNPQYRKFQDNCTNFISQCLRAGGAPMTGYPNRSKGWWYRDNNWSFSWSVAHSLRWYLSGATSGLRGKEMHSAKELSPGDVICYDFNGDGRWQHTTIVVDKDANGEPLVNAQTTNSRMRYWKYEDSTAWTPNIKYKFFQIV